MPYNTPFCQGHNPFSAIANKTWWEIDMNMSIPSKTYFERKS